MFEKEIYGGNSLVRPLGDLPSRLFYIEVDIYKVNGTPEEMEKGTYMQCPVHVFLSLVAQLSYRMNIHQLRD